MIQKERMDNGEEKVDQEQSLAATTRLSLQEALGSPFTNQHQLVAGNYAGLPSSAGANFFMNNMNLDPSMHNHHLHASRVAMDTVALMRRQQEEQTLLASRMLFQHQQQDQAVLNSMGNAPNRLAAGPPLLGNTAATRAGLEHVSLLIQQQISQQQDLNLLRSQAGLITVPGPLNNMDTRTNANSAFFQHLQQLAQQEPMFELNSGHSDAAVTRANKPTNVQQDANAAYYDASTLPDPEHEEGEDDSEDEDDYKMRPKGGIIEPFPSKLFRMIDDADKEGLDDIISFFTHGRAFAIHKPRGFISELMPKYFSTSRMSSFQRQLNLYGFRRITEGRDKGGYFHEFFLKGRRGLCKKIKRKKLLKIMPEVPMSRGSATFPNNQFVPSVGGNQPTMPSLSDATNLYQLQMLAQAGAGNPVGMIGGFGGTSGGYGGASGGFPGLGGLGSLATNVGDPNGFSAQQLLLGNAGRSVARNPSMQSMSNAASFMEQKQLLAQLQQLQQLQQFSAPSNQRRGPQGFGGAPPTA